MKLKKSTIKFIKHLLWQELQAEENFGHQEKSEYADDLIDAYRDFELASSDWIEALGIESKEELSEKIYG